MQPIKCILANIFLLWVLGVSNAAIVVAAMYEPLISKLSVDELEIGDRVDHPLMLKGQYWKGSDRHKVGFKTELERTQGHSEEIELQALYSRPIAPHWDLQLGFRRDFQPYPRRNWAVVTVQGLAPFFFDVELSLFLGESNRSAIRFEAEYELRLTQRLLLVSDLEVNAFGQSDVALGLGSGLADSTLGLRCRYEINRKLASYIGITRLLKYGDTANFARDSSNAVANHNHALDDHDHVINLTQFVLGLSFWF